MTRGRLGLLLFTSVMAIACALLSSTAGAAELEASPDELFFGRVAVGQAGGPKKVLIGTYFPQDIKTISVSGDFTETNDCPHALNMFGRCRVQVTFEPRSEGPLKGALTIISGDAARHRTGGTVVRLRGNGTNSFPPPFNTSKGEGKLIRSDLVTTYSTGSSEASAALSGDPVTGLDTFYSQLICNGLTSTDCTTNENNLNTPQFGNFDLAADPIAHNPFGIKLIDAIKINYTALNVDQSALPVSGGILVPEVAPSALKGIILYFHGTTVQRNNVPSNFTPTTTISGYTQGVLFAAVWASQGYVVVMPDYVGLGDDTTHVHPYVEYPGQNAQSGLAMLKAARKLLAKKYRITGPLALYITGYSEGGGYSLKAAHLMQDNPNYASTLNLNLRIAVPLSGFFDLSNTGLSYLFDNITALHNQWYSRVPLESAVSKPLLSADLVLSFANYSNIPATDILVNDFYTCAASISTDCGSSGDLDGLYFTAAQGPNYNQLVATDTYSQARLTTWTLLKNAITPLLTATYASGLMERDPTNLLYQQVVSADTYEFVPEFPVTLTSLEEDSVVTRKNTDVAFAYFTSENPAGLYQKVLIPNNNFLAASSMDFLSAAAGAATGPSPIDHTTEVPFMSVLILNQFNTSP